MPCMTHFGCSQPAEERPAPPLDRQATNAASKRNVNQRNARVASSHLILVDDCCQA